MDRADRDLLALLSVRIASIMEDEVGDAIEMLPTNASAIAACFARLGVAGRDIAMLSAAADAILRRSGVETA